MSDRSGSPDSHSPVERSPQRSSSRRTNVRISSKKASTAPRSSRLSVRSSSTRNRRATPAPAHRHGHRERPLDSAGSSPPPVSLSRQRRRGSNLDLSDEDSSSLTVQSTNNAEHSSGRRGRRVVSRSHQFVVSSSGSQGQRLAWYERLLPECVLAMSSPLTGYETALEPDVADEEYEILERERVRRNRRIRKRLLTLLFMAGAATAFVYVANGRLFRKVAVKASVNTIKHRFEDGLVRTIHDTMGK